MPFLAALTLLFIGLKLTDHIEWSWWSVLGPIWVPTAILTLLLAGGATLKPKTSLTITR